MTGKPPSARPARAAAPRRRRVLVPVLAAGLSVALLAACSGDGQPAASPASDSATPSPTASATPSTTPSAVSTDSPLSGRPDGAGKRVLVVKLDNTPSAQPHRGLVDADMVFVEPVEWGLTRLAAVFATDVPAVAGPVRSARISDIDVFAPFGDISFVYSGSQTRLIPKIKAADWTPVSPDFDSPGFHREYGTGRAAPWNLMAEPRTILATSGSKAEAPDLGLVFSEPRPAGGTKARTVTATWENSRTAFTWNKKADAYDVWFDRRAARDTQRPGVQRASTVIVQYVKEVDSGYGDKFGGRTPLTIVTGEGKALLLRDGRMWKIRWSKPTKAAPTAYTDAAGTPVRLAPGQVWVVLKNRKDPVTVDQ